MSLRRFVRRAARTVADSSDRAVRATGRPPRTPGPKRPRGAAPAMMAAASKLFAPKPPSKRAPSKRAKPEPRGRGAVRRGPGPAAKGARRTGPSPFGLLDAFGFFLAAGLILAHVRPARGGAHPAALAVIQPGRGRDAEHPLEIPPKGWRDIVSRTWTNFNNDKIMATAGGVTFFSLLALFPAIAAFVSLYGLFLDEKGIGQQLSVLSGFVPRDIVNFIGGEMTRIATRSGGRLGFTFALSLAVSLWSANGAVKALFGGLNVAYEERETRGFLHLTALTLAFTLGGILFALVAVGAVVVAPAALGFLHVDAGGWWLAALRWPALLLVLGLGLSVVYRYGPSRAQPRWRWITPGGMVAAVLWLAASLLFSWYVQSFGQLDKTYGSLGAVVGFMTWLWYSTIIVLVGAELNAEIEHQTAVDTTDGPARPPGARGAAMADSVGAATPG